MKFWDYIGEFLLFRRLFGSYKHNEAKRDVAHSPLSSADSDSADDADSHFCHGRFHDNWYSHYDNQDYGCSQSYDDFLDEQDYDMMDDDF